MKFIIFILLILPCLCFAQIGANAFGTLSRAEQPSVFSANIELAFDISCDRKLPLKQKDIALYAGLNFGIQTKADREQRFNDFDNQLNIFFRGYIKTTDWLFIGPYVNYQILNRAWFNFGISGILPITNKVQIVGDLWLGEGNSYWSPGANLGLRLNLKQ